jgi:hypothetical protein
VVRECKGCVVSGAGDGECIEGIIVCHGYRGERGWNSVFRFTSRVGIGIGSGRWGSKRRLNRSSYWWRRR